jgi:hypothetical protein
MHGMMLTHQFMSIKIIHYGNQLFTKHQNSTTHTIVEMLISVSLHIHSKEKLNHIHSSLLDKFTTGIKLMENYHLSTHLKFLTQMIDLFNTVTQLINSLENNVQLEEFQLNLEQD